MKIIFLNKIREKDMKKIFVLECIKKILLLVLFFVVFDQNASIKETVLRPAQINLSWGEELSNLFNKKFILQAVAGTLWVGLTAFLIKKIFFFDEQKWKDLDSRLTEASSKIAKQETDLLEANNKIIIQDTALKEANKRIEEERKNLKFLGEDIALQRTKQSEQQDKITNMVRTLETQKTNVSELSNLVKENQESNKTVLGEFKREADAIKAEFKSKADVIEQATKDNKDIIINQAKLNDEFKNNIDLKIKEQETKISNSFQEYKNNIENKWQQKKTEFDNKIEANETKYSDLLQGNNAMYSKTIQTQGEEIKKSIEEYKKLLEKAQKEYQNNIETLNQDYNKQIEEVKKIHEEILKGQAEELKLKQEESEINTKRLKIEEEKLNLQKEEIEKKKNREDLAREFNEKNKEQIDKLVNELEQMSGILSTYTTQGTQNAEYNKKNGYITFFEEQLEQINKDTFLKDSVRSQDILVYMMEREEFRKNSWKDTNDHDYTPTIEDLLSNQEIKQTVDQLISEYKKLSGKINKEPQFHPIYKKNKEMIDYIIEEYNKFLSVQDAITKIDNDRYNTIITVSQSSQVSDKILFEQAEDILGISRTNFNCDYLLSDIYPWLSKTDRQDLQSVVKKVNDETNKRAKNISRQYQWWLSEKEENKDRITNYQNIINYISQQISGNHENDYNIYELFEKQASEIHNPTDLLTFYENNILKDEKNNKIEIRDNEKEIINGLLDTDFKKFQAAVFKEKQERIKNPERHSLYVTNKQHIERIMKEVTDLNEYHDTIKENTNKDDIYEKLLDKLNLTKEKLEANRFFHELVLCCDQNFGNDLSEDIFAHLNLDKINSINKLYNNLCLENKTRNTSPSRKYQWYINSREEDIKKIKDRITVITESIKDNNDDTYEKYSVVLENNEQYTPVLNKIITELNLQDMQIGNIIDYLAEDLATLKSAFKKESEERVCDSERCYVGRSCRGKIEEYYKQMNNFFQGLAATATITEKINSDYIRMNNVITSNKDNKDLSMVFFAETCKLYGIKFDQFNYSQVFNILNSNHKIELESYITKIQEEHQLRVTEKSRECEWYVNDKKLQDDIQKVNTAIDNFCSASDLNQSFDNQVNEDLYLKLIEYIENNSERNDKISYNVAFIKLLFNHLCKIYQKIDVDYTKLLGHINISNLITSVEKEKEKRLISPNRSCYYVSLFQELGAVMNQIHSLNNILGKEKIDSTEESNDFFEQVAKKYTWCIDSLDKIKEIEFLDKLCNHYKIKNDQNKLYLVMSRDQRESIQNLKMNCFREVGLRELFASRGLTNEQKEYLRQFRIWLKDEIQDKLCGESLLDKQSVVNLCNEQGRTLIGLALYEFFYNLFLLNKGNGIKEGNNTHTYLDKKDQEGIDSIKNLLNQAFKTLQQNAEELQKEKRIFDNVKSFDRLDTQVLTMDDQEEQEEFKKLEIQKKEIEEARAGIINDFDQQKRESKQAINDAYNEFISDKNQEKMMTAFLDSLFSKYKIKNNKQHIDNPILQCIAARIFLSCNLLSIPDDIVAVKSDEKILYQERIRDIINIQNALENIKSEEDFLVYISLVRQFIKQYNHSINFKIGESNKELDRLFYNKKDSEECKKEYLRFFRSFLFLFYKLYEDMIHKKDDFNKISTKLWDYFILDSFLYLKKSEKELDVNGRIRTLNPDVFLYRFLGEYTLFVEQLNKDIPKKIALKNTIQDEANRAPMSLLFDAMATIGNKTIYEEYNKNTESLLCRTLQDDFIKKLVSYLSAPYLEYIENHKNVLHPDSSVTLLSNIIQIMFFEDCPDKIGYANLIHLKRNGKDDIDYDLIPYSLPKRIEERNGLFSVKELNEFIDSVCDVEYVKNNLELTYPKSANIKHRYHHDFFDKPERYFDVTAWLSKKEAELEKEKQKRLQEFDDQNKLFYDKYYKLQSCIQEKKSGKVLSENHVKSIPLECIKYQWNGKIAAKIKSLLMQKDDSLMNLMNHLQGSQINTNDSNDDLYDLYSKIKAIDKGDSDFLRSVLPSFEYNKGSVLELRSSLAALLSNVYNLKAFKAHYLLNGDPGTGKSAFLSFAIRKFVEEYPNEEIKNYLKNNIYLFSISKGYYSNNVTVDKGLSGDINTIINSKDSKNIILFVLYDECDALVCKKAEHKNNSDNGEVNTLLTMIDASEGKSYSFFGTTNLYEFTQAMCRDGRLNNILVKYPSENNIIKHLTQKKTELNNLIKCIDDSNAKNILNLKINKIIELLENKATIKATIFGNDKQNASISYNNINNFINSVSANKQINITR
jgi:hypothetical protein